MKQGTCRECGNDVVRRPGARGPLPQLCPECRPSTLSRSERAVKASRARWGGEWWRGPNAVQDCQVDGCEAPNFASGWCQKHYRRWQIHGAPEPEHLQPRRCANCPAVFTPAKAHRGTTPPLYCSRFCADLARGARTYGPKGGVIVCALCNQRKAVPVLANTKSCLDCRAEWTVRTQVNWRSENPERVRDALRRRDQRRRAQRRGTAAVVEDITASEIYERDGWRCGLCGGRVPKARSYPHPKSASLDHIVPLSLGGTHTLDNVQLAHLGCNVRKGVKAMNEQLLLVG